MSKLLLYIWQLPQHLLGLLLVVILRCRYYGRRGTARVYSTGVRIGVSLGDYIIIYSHLLIGRVIAHEWGHSRQSRLLGPFYLPVVGLPSLMMNIATRLGLLRAERYYKRWPENWADRLGAGDTGPQKAEKTEKE